MKSYKVFYSNNDCIWVIEIIDEGVRELIVCKSFKAMVKTVVAHGTHFNPWEHKGLSDMEAVAAQIFKNNKVAQEVFVKEVFGD